MTRTIAIVNQKGGVGKTTTAVNLSASLAAAERSVLLIDMDPQGNAGSGLGIRPEPEQPQTYHVLLGQVSLEEALVETNLPGLAVLPSGRDLIGAEVELIQEIGRERRLLEAMEPYKERFDFIFIDCPPSLGLLTLNALTASDSIFVPVQTEYYAMEGVGHLLHAVDLVRKRLNADLEIEGVLLTMADFRTNLARQVSEEIRSFFGQKVYRTVINRNIRLSEAPSHGQPVLLYDIASRGSQQYLDLAREFLEAQPPAGQNR